MTFRETFDLYFRCIWCGKIKWPIVQRISPGGSMHFACHLDVKNITVETQKQYMMRQAELRWEEEDRL